MNINTRDGSDDFPVGLNPNTLRWASVILGGTVDRICSTAYDCPAEG